MVILNTADQTKCSNKISMGKNIFRSIIDSLAGPKAILEFLLEIL